MPSFAATTMISVEPGKTSGIYDDFPKDQLLQVSRRLDWRFLLPNPDLGSVAYLGPEEDSLVDALHLFCQTLTQISSSQLSGTNLNDFDLVVIKKSIKPITRIGCATGQAGWISLCRNVRLVEGGQTAPLYQILL